MKKASEDARERFKYPTQEAIAFLAKAMNEAEKVYKERPQGELVFSTETISVPVPLADPVVQALRKVNADMLKATELCDRCRAEQEEAGLPCCPGVYDADDLLKNIVACALRVGMLGLLEAVLSLEEDNSYGRQSSVQEFFGPVLSQITDPYTD